MIEESGIPGSEVLGIGSDIVDVHRFRGVLQRRPSLAGRLFTSGELDYAERFVDPTERLAARFAAKEATLKALGFGLGNMRMVDIEVVRTSKGSPRLVLRGEAAAKATACGVSRWLVTISHTSSLASATVLALR